ncbi:MAG: hypothetical protein K8W52_15635 [Deltaproteobacteria bacterium]|nr:hypothetical protein [Deltaproteobacteria bacterium]
MRRAALLVFVVGCYHGARATRDVNAAWRGHTRAEIEARWGTPQVAGQTLAWSYDTTRIELPRAAASLAITPTSIDAAAAFDPGSIETTAHVAVATLDANGRIAELRGPSLHWGPPRDANLHWGTLFGAHVGLGRLDSTGTPLPSGGLYIGGMVSRTVGLVGTFSMVSGSDTGGGAIGFAWGIAAQQWMSPRIAVRAGPAMILAFTPGFDHAIGLGDSVVDTIGLGAAASVALVRTRVFVLDLRFELTTSPAATFGDLGVGVNLN